MIVVITVLTSLVVFPALVWIASKLEDRRRIKHEIARPKDWSDS